MFLRNEKGLGVKNGTLGTVEQVERGVLQVRLDDRDQTRILVDSVQYQDLDYGYASTIHKSQGATVDRSYVLASRYFDRHTSYVALSRHRESATLFYSKEEFVGRAGQAGVPNAVEARLNLESTLTRPRPKELAHDYLDPQLLADPKTSMGGRGRAETETSQSNLENTPAAIQQRAREAWAQLRAKDAKASLSAEEIQAQARERWQQYRKDQVHTQDPHLTQGTQKSHAKARSRGKDDDQSL